MSLNIEISKDGYNILKFDIDGKSKYFGSRYNQKREIDKFIKDVGELNIKTNIIVFGIGFCDHLKELLKVILPQNNILVVEYNIELIEYCKTSKDISDIIKNPQITLASNEKDIKIFFDKYINEGNVDQIRGIDYLKYYTTFKDKMSKLYESIQKEITRITLNKNTVLLCGDEYLKTFLSNFPYFALNEDITYIKDSYKDKPAVIVSAGPSLSKNIHELKGKDNILIFSGGRTLRPLIENGIMPSCIGIVDNSEVSYKLVQGYIDKVECPLYFNDFTPISILKKHKGQKVFSVQNTFFNSTLKKEIPSLYGGGSIAHSLTLLAIYMGCNPIIFIGQDFAYTGEKGHAEIAENYWQNLTYDDFYKSNDDLYVEDIYGKPVRTSIALNNYRCEMEEIIKNNSNIKFINATEGGANFKGTQIEKLEDVLNSLENKKIENINSIINKIDNREIFIDSLHNTLNNFKMYIKWCNELQELINLCRKFKKMNMESQYLKNGKILNELVKKIQKPENYRKLEIINAKLSQVIYIVENSNEFIINKNDSENIIFEKQIGKIERMYKSIREVIENSYPQVEQVINNLKKLKLENKNV